MPARKFSRHVQEQRLTKVFRLAGPRYTPKLNVGVNITPVFDALGRTLTFYESLKKPGAELLRNFRCIKDEEIGKFARNEFETLQELCREIAVLVANVPQSRVRPIPFDRLLDLGTRARDAASQCLHLLYEAEAAERRRKAEETAQAKRLRKKEKLDSYEELFRNERYYFHQVMAHLRSLAELSETNAAAAANNPRVVLAGIAGSGKTHFLCDLAKHRIDQGLPTFIFLGEEIDSKNPWKAIKGLLGATGTDQEFLSALNQYAVRKRTRAVIVIDAVNESLVRPDWNLLNKIKNFKYLGLVLSIRSGFEQSDLPASIPKEYVRVEHPGFAEHEWEAVTKFFKEYKLPLPEVPLLFPEFRIPLFLKIFCESFAGSKHAIKGHYGFTHIFEQYVKRQGVALLKRLGETANLGESRRRIWDGSIKEIALYMGEHGTDRVSEEQCLSIVSKQFREKAKTALALLEKYWLLTKVPRYKDYNVAGFDYRFPYQKFSDHLIVRSLLEKHLDTTSPARSFRKGTVLYRIVSNVWSNRGLIEALSIQIPQRLHGRELVYITPARFRTQQVARECFLESLVWRDISLIKGRPRFIKIKRVLAYLNKYILPFPEGNDQIFETVLTVATVPNHPLNAHLLHRHLLRWKMPKRDAIWLPFINSRYGDGSAINRLITWAWNGGAKSQSADEALRLAGIALAWCLASSNRFLRDQATKALVSMFACRIPILIELLKIFSKIDDPYIAERLYAAAYGCALQPDSNNEDVVRLAVEAYRRIFRNRRPPPHLLLRDYARGVIEVALARNPSLAERIDIQRIRPPYGSLFPSRAPSLTTLRRQYYPKRKSYKRKDSDYWGIWHSLMYNNEGGIADFGNYVVNSKLGHWCNLRIATGKTRPKTVKELNTEFSAGLSESERTVWEEMESKRSALSLERLRAQFPVAANETRENAFRNPASAELDLKNQETAFISRLSKTMQRLYRYGVVPYRDNPHEYDILDYAAIQRLIFARVVDLGWRPKLFQKYDSNVQDVGREPHKLERIGKKYQWIAFHEILGRIADNFVFRGEWRDNFVPYNGPWQIGARDIDPSCLLRTTPEDSTTTKPWWLPFAYNKWRPRLTDAEWTRVGTDLPDQKRLLTVSARGGWFVLDGFLRWEQQPMPGEDEFTKIRRDVWYILRSYIAERDKADRLIAWAKRQDFMGRWMPEPIELRDVFLKEIPDCMSYVDGHGPKSIDRWIKVRDKQGKSTKFRLMRTTEEYIWEGSGFDCSVSEAGVHVNLPARELIEGMKFLHSALPDRFEDSNGQVTVIDPSVAEKGPSMLLARKGPFLKFLRENNYELLWVIIGEKLLVGGTSVGRAFPGRLEIGGAFRLRANGTIEGATYAKHLPPTTA